MKLLHLLYCICLVALVVFPSIASAQPNEPAVYYYDLKGRWDDSESPDTMKLIDWIKDCTIQYGHPHRLLVHTTRFYFVSTTNMLKAAGCSVADMGWGSLFEIEIKKSVSDFDFAKCTAPVPDIPDERYLICGEPAGPEVCDACYTGEPVDYMSEELEMFHTWIRIDKLGVDGKGFTPNPDDDGVPNPNLPEIDLDGSPEKQMAQGIMYSWATVCSTHVPSIIESETNPKLFNIFFVSSEKMIEENKCKTMLKFFFMQIGAHGPIEVSHGWNVGKCLRGGELVCEEQLELLKTGVTPDESMCPPCLSESRNSAFDHSPLLSITLFSIIAIAGLLM